jgi:Uncharacterized protein conserved in archaea
MRHSVQHHRTASMAAIALVAVLAACADDGGKFDQDRYREQDQGGAMDETNDPAASPAPSSTSSTVALGATDADPPTAGELDDDELAGLLWMREEEQLAHDVYVELGDRWGLRVFENIAASEQQHIDVTKGLLDRYGVADPAADNPSGTFTDPRIQELYDDLIARGATSREDALAVGATIEELDIADLRARADATDEAALDDAYARLERASRNHLRAFVSRLDLLGVEYEPTVLDDFDEIVAAPMERGRDGH